MTKSNRSDRHQYALEIAGHSKRHAKAEHRDGPGDHYVTCSAAFAHPARESSFGRHVAIRQPVHGYQQQNDGAGDGHVEAIKVGKKSHTPILPSPGRLTPSRNGNELCGPLRQPLESSRIDSSGGRMFGLAPIHILLVFVLSVAVIAGVVGSVCRLHRPLLGLAALLAAISACYLPPAFAFFKAYPAAFWVFCAALLLSMWVARYRQFQRMEMESQKNQP